MKKNTLIVALILLIFFVISFLTNILGPIIPDIIDSFTLSIGLAGFLPFAFFVAYAVMSIPSGILVEKYKEKKMLIFAFTMAFIGALLFAFIPGFSVALISLFIIGIGMAVLQVVINPLLRTAGGEEHFAFNSVMGQLAFGAASFLSPMLYSYLVTNIHTTDDSLIFSFLNPMVPEDLKWVSLYWVFAAIAFLMVIIVYFAKFPKVELKSDEKIDVGVAFKELLANKYVLLYFLGIFCYVGTEQGIANWISKFLQSYHGIDPSTTGAIVISYFWGLLTVGCLLGLVLLKFLDSRTVLITFTLGAIISLLAGLFGTAEIALIAFPLTGFFASVMWSIIFSLALNSVPQHHGTFSGILCTGIAGGAIVPLVIGGLAELVGLKLSMLFLLLTLGYILSIGIWAKPLVTNATKSLKDIFK
ncbi:MFS transporter [Cyclobacterium amurskyense]|uniref:Putative sugar permease n=1 Tax=Cyclobacterium amurskyense TaxID=320787 RepID=A0A0H4PAE6_9BACT|nr:MFS transporter [Cyclobacterium amurskyense]AKP51426.1 Putative sugar permease [Cyclobacterium amurskyense]|tara:strand:+ start:5070 stop:6317 length:1248 start_codon:yes stop_codon:yes gene_type:complete